MPTKVRDMIQAKVKPRKVRIPVGDDHHCGNPEFLHFVKEYVRTETSFLSLEDKADLFEDGGREFTETLLQEWEDEKMLDRQLHERDERECGGQGEFGGR